ncbi:RNA polymerase sigma factor [Roseimaritima ulvae]|uniref:RNA polymerase sigma factor SigM n=1 Tax=Roseimaritima ulvae TaxID=980254 RepID=A0A5B9R2Y6_9BACT|nr:sigma-70 family RNA polymerase sigma factor [Roseimaritima ulvae]QEG43816.1 RNA polymerase sigma factor SigM [Roseimaritima ulvae]
MTDELIDVQRLRVGDHQAWDALYSSACRRTYRVLYHLTGAKQSVLEELNQDVWLSALQSIERLDATRGTAVDWVLGIARHKGLTYLRKHYANRVVFVGAGGDMPDLSFADDGPSPAHERAMWLRAAIESLPEHWQYVLRQKYHVGLTVQQIADQMDRTPKAIESTLSRARARLRELVSEWKDEP